VHADAVDVCVLVFQEETLSGLFWNVGAASFEPLLRLSWSLRERGRGTHEPEGNQTKPFQTHETLLGWKHRGELQPDGDWSGHVLDPDIERYTLKNMNNL
jgi:hypothetical protein